MTNLPLPDIRARVADEHSGDSQQRDRYLPSAQVLAELAVLGPNLARLATDLRDRLSDETNRSAT